MWPPAVALSALAATLVACSDDAGGCVEVDPECAPLYEPTFDNVFSMTLNDKCADGPCHDAVSPKAGLSYVDPDEAYDQLLGETGRVRVMPGDPGCSLLVRRIEGSGSFRMPPGNPLSEQERCSIELWIANGAER